VAVTPRARDEGAAPLAGSGAVLSADVQLMQDYRLGQPQAPSNQAAVALVPALAGSEFDVIAFSSVDLMLYLQHDPDSDTGWKATTFPAPRRPSTPGYCPMTPAAVRNADGSVSVYAQDGTTYGLVRADSRNGWAWSPVAVPGIDRSHRPIWLVAHPAMGALPAGVAVVFAATLSPSDRRVEVWLSAAQNALFASSSGTSGSVTYGCMAAVAVDDDFSTLVLSHPDRIEGMVFGSVPTPQQLTEISAESGLNYGAYVALLPGNQELYSADPTSGVCVRRAPSPSYFGQQPGTPVFSKQPAGRILGMAVAQDGAGNSHMILTTNDPSRAPNPYRLLHARRLAGSRVWTDPVVIAEGTSRGATLACDPDGNVVFAAPVYVSAQKRMSVCYGVCDAGSGEWTIEQIESETFGPQVIEQVFTYSATVFVHDAKHRPQVAVPITIKTVDASGSPPSYTPATAELSIQGQLVTLDGKTPWNGWSGADGRVSIVYQTTSLGAPSLLVSTDDMRPDEVFAVDLSYDTRSELGKVTSADYLKTRQSATSHKLSYTSGLLLATDAQKGAADTLAKTVAASMQIAKKPHVEHSARVHPASSPGVLSYIPSWDGRSPNRIDTTGLSGVYFLLDLSGDMPVYSELDAAGAAAVKERMLAQQDVLPFFGGWTDLFASVGQGIAELSLVLVNAAAHGAEATIQFVLDGVTYVLHAVLDLVDQLLDVIQEAFASAKVTFENVVGWIGWVFKWDDILRTHTALVYIVNVGLDEAKIGLGEIRGKARSAMDELRAELRTNVKSLVSRLDPHQTLAGMAATPPPPNVQLPRAGDPRNVFGRAFHEQAGSATISVPAHTSSAGEQIVSTVGALSEQANATPAMSRMTESIANGGNDSDGSGVLDQTAASFVTAAGEAADAALEAIEDGIDGLLGLLITGVDDVQALLNAEWGIPLISDLYAWLTESDAHPEGAKLTALDLTCLLLAVPVTLAYKLGHPTAPYPDEQSIVNLKAAYPPKSSAADEPPASAHADAPLVPASTASDLTTVALIGAYAGATLSILSAPLQARMDVCAAGENAVKEGAEPLKLPTWILDDPVGWWAGASLVVECAQWAFGGMSGVSTMTTWWRDWCAKTPQARANVLWLFLFLQVAADAYCFVQFKRAPLHPRLFRQVETYGPVALTVLGVLQLAVHISVWVQQSIEQGADQVWASNFSNVLGDIPAACKWLLLGRLGKSSRGASIVAIGVIDGVCGVASGVFGYVAAATGEVS
jgi:hypothetical protein